MTEERTGEKTRIFRYEVPVDDRWHPIGLSGGIVHVAARDPRVVEFWAFSTCEPEFTAEFRVFGTGHLLPDEWSRHVGSAIAADGRLIWHLIERDVSPSAGSSEEHKGE